MIAFNLRRKDLAVIAIASLCLYTMLTALSSEVERSDGDPLLVGRNLMVFDDWFTSSPSKQRSTTRVLPVDTTVPFAPYDMQSALATASPYKSTWGVALYCPKENEFIALAHRNHNWREGGKEQPRSISKLCSHLNLNANKQTTSNAIGVPSAVHSVPLQCI
jgi:hypothetical protein